MLGSAQSLILLQYEKLLTLPQTVQLYATTDTNGTVDTTNGKAGAFPPSPPLLAPLRAGWAFPPTWGRGLGKRWARGSRMGFPRTGGKAAPGAGRRRGGQRDDGGLAVSEAANPGPAIIA